MAESVKKDNSSVNVKEKNSLQDLEFGNDFLSSWKSMSMAKEDVMDFDLASVSKGNKKSFDFDKADIDFNLDGDFGKMSSFNMDMPDLDISPPFKKDGKSAVKSKESTTGKSEGKTDHFAFAFDFDELENFSLDSSLTKESSKAQSEKNNKENSPNESGSQDKEGSIHINLFGSKNTSAERPQKPSLPETRITLDMDGLVGGSTDLEPTGKTCPSDLAMDDSVTSEFSAAINEVVSDKAESLPVTRIVSREQPNISQSKKLVCPGLSDLEACTRNDAVQDSSFDSFSNNEPSGGNSPEAQNKVDSTDTHATGSKGEQVANVISIGSTFNEKHTISKNSQHLQIVAVSENINGKTSQVGFEDHVMDNRGRTELCQVNPLAEDSFPTSAVSGILHDTPSGKENLETASVILKVPLVSQPDDLSKKRTENEREPFVNGAQPSILSEQPECPVLKASTHTSFSSLRSTKTGFAQPNLVEGRGEVRNVDGLQNRKILNHSSTTQIKDMMKTKSALGQREMIVEDLRTPSQPAHLLDKQTENRGEPLVNCSRPFIRSEKPECHVLRASTPTTFSSLSSKKMGFAQPNQVEGTRDMDAIRSEKKLVSLPLQYSKTLPRGRGGTSPDTESGNLQREVCGADVKDGEKMNASSTTQIKEMMKTKSPLRQREMSMKDHDILSVEMNRISVQDGGNPTTVASLPIIKNTHAGEHRFSSTEVGRKSPDLPVLKLSRLSFDSTKSPMPRDINSVENCCQKRVLVRKVPSDVARFPDKQKQMPFILGMKRKLQDIASDIVALPPPKRLTQSATTTSNFVETSEKVLHKKVPWHSHVEDDCSKNTIGSCQVMELHLPHEVKSKEVAISFSIQNDSNIRLADAYSKELDDICNILRKKHDEAKEILARAIVNSNKLLMLNNPGFDEKIRSTQKLFARLTLNSIHG